MKLRQSFVIQISTTCLMLASLSGLSVDGNDNFQSDISQSSHFDSESVFIELFAATPIKSSSSEPEPEPRNILDGSFLAV